MSDVICKRLFVLITHDSEDDSFFIERALRESARFQVIASVNNAQEAIAYLAGQGQYADRQLWPFPNVLLLHLTKMHAEGFEIVEWLQRSLLTDLRIAVHSGSSTALEVQRIRTLGADVFCAGTAQHAKVKLLVNEMENLLLASGPNGEVTISAFRGR